MLRVLNETYDDPMELEEKAVSILAGGIAQPGVECGMLWGSSLAAGARSYHLYGPGSEAEYKTLKASGELVRFFEGKFQHKFCSDLTHIDSDTSKLKMFYYFFLKGGTLKCLNMGMKFSQQALELIDKVLGMEESRDSDSFSNCCTTLAEKLELSDLHRTMISGLAGGIGLCGGGCGAMAAAVWLKQMQLMKGKDEIKMDLKNPEIHAMIDKFRQLTDGELVCSKITGRYFKDIKEHSDFIRKGGCKEIVELLVSELN